MEEEKHLLQQLVWNRIIRIARIVNYMLIVREVQHLFGGTKASEKREALHKKIKELKEEANKL